MACPIKEIPAGSKLFRPLDPDFYYNLAIYTTYFDSPSYHAGKAYYNRFRANSFNTFYKHYVESGHKIFVHLYLDRFFNKFARYQFSAKKYEGHELLYEVYKYDKHIFNVYFDDEDFMTKYIKVAPIAVLDTGLKFEKYFNYILIEELEDYLTNQRYEDGRFDIVDDRYKDDYYDM